MSKIKKRKAAINVGLKRKCKTQHMRAAKRHQHNHHPGLEEEFIQILKRFGQNPDNFMNDSDIGFGDDDPAYDMSDPDVTIDDMSCYSSPSYSDDSWQSTSDEEEAIGDLIMDQGAIPQSPAAMPLAAMNNQNKPLVSSNNNKTNNHTSSNNSNAAAINVASDIKSSSSNNNNNNKVSQQQSTPSDLDAFFSEQRRIFDEQQQQQKWNLFKSTKIPTLFLPKVDQIQPLLDRLNKLEGVTNGYTTKCTQNGAIRLHCNSMEIYQKTA
ncbi:hypothetical protein ACLKA7_005270 [Drosophila subpalustris]